MPRLLPLLLIIGSCIVGTTLGCTCDHTETDAQTYCRSGFAILAKVKDSGRIIDGNKVFKIKILWRFKSNIPWRRVDQTRLYSGIDSAGCGVWLRRGRVYLITGGFEAPFLNPNASQRRFDTRSCGIQTSVSSIRRGRWHVSYKIRPRCYKRPR